MKRRSVALRVETIAVVAIFAFVGCSKPSLESESTSTSGSGTADAIPRKPVSSSALRSVGYDASRRILVIEFHNGSVYRYFDVPSNVHVGLMEASSHGKYFHRHIRNSGYRYSRARPDRDEHP